MNILYNWFYIYTNILPYYINNNSIIHINENIIDEDEELYDFIDYNSLPSFLIYT